MTLFDVESRPAPEGPLARMRLVVAYDGARFRGFAPNPGVKTVGGALTAALAKILRHAVVITCAGRTDAGVHAWGQVVTFDTSVARADPAGLQRSLNRLLGPEIVVREAAIAPGGFDARRSATGRRYRYTVLNRAVPDPFLARTAWHVGPPLDLAVMQLACDPLIGEHDFTSFCRQPRPAPDGRESSMVRTVRQARWSDLGDGVLRFDIESSSFCQQMVRSIVGTIVDMGLGKRRPGEMVAILRARDRSAAGRVAPPHGLCLWEVVYPREAFGS